MHLGKRPSKIHQIALDNQQLVTSALDLFAKRGYRHLALAGTEVPDERLHSCDVENTFRSLVEASGNHPFAFRFGFNQSLTLALSS